jgi:hypothetical protein
VFEGLDAVRNVPRETKVVDADGGAGREDIRAGRKHLVAVVVVVVAENGWCWKCFVEDGKAAFAHAPSLPAQPPQREESTGREEHVKIKATDEPLTTMR